MRYLIHWFPSCSGGLCDRILGLSSSICIAKMLNMEILIRWDHCDLSLGFEINPKYNWYCNSVNYRHIIMSNMELLDYFNKVDIVKEWEKDNIMIWSNVNLFNYCLTNPFLKDIIPLDYINEFSIAIHIILENIFIIKPKILQNVKQYKNGLHIRTGDKQIYIKENEEFYRDYITNILKNIKEIENENIFISSDCLLTLVISKDIFKDFDYNEGCIIHTTEETKINEEGLHKVILDLLNLCKCENKLYIGWNSNFSRIAALYNPNRKFICYEYENVVNEIKECSKEKLFEYFSWGKYT